MGISQGRQDRIDTKLYKWSTEEFREECALIYTSRGRVLETRSCTFYWRVKRDKVVFIMNDGLCDGNNRVRLNMEFVAVRDEKRSFKFGPVKFKESGTKFNKQIRRSSKSKVLFLNYEGSFESRTNQFGLYQRKKNQKYEVIFHTGYSDDCFMHIMRIHCDPSKGIDVNLSGPYRRRSGENESFDTEYISGMAPDDVINNANDILNELKIEDGNSVGASGGSPPENNTAMNTGLVLGNFNGSIIRDSTFITYDGGQH